MTTDEVFGRLPDGRVVRLLTIGAEPGPVGEHLGFTRAMSADGFVSMATPRRGST